MALDIHPRFEIVQGLSCRFRTCINIAMDVDNEGNDKVAPLTKVEGENGTSTRTRVVHGEDSLRKDTLGQRRSHVCCMYCCDTRRAVIVVNTISISFAVLSILMVVTLTSKNFVDRLDDDQTLEELGTLDENAVFLTNILALACIACCICGIYGAAKFNRLFVFGGAVWYGLDIVRSIVFFDILGLLLACGFLYPHVIFIYEINQRIMTPGNYPMEDRCCCCV